MKVAHADTEQPTLVGLDDTQQIHPMGASGVEGVAQRRRISDDAMIVWGLFAAILFSAAALGAAVIALVSSPDAVAGPQGPAGVQGASGVQGIQGVAGPQGPTGLTGPAGAKGAIGATGARGLAGATGASGTVAASSPVSGASVLSQMDPPVGTAVTASAVCPQGDIVLGGGAVVSAPGNAAKDVVLRASLPTPTNGWRATGTVISPLPVGEQMTVRPYVLCGKASHS